MLMKPLMRSWCFPWNPGFKALQVKKKVPDAVFYLFDTTDLNELQERLIGRDRFWESYCLTYIEREEIAHR